MLCTAGLVKIREREIRTRKTNVVSIQENRTARYCDS